METVRYRKDGSPVHVIAAGSPIMAGDALVGIVAIYTDITTRKQAEEERERLLEQIREQARQVKQVIDTVPAGVLLLDADLRVLVANPKAEEYLGVLAGAKVGDTLAALDDRPVAELLTSPPEGLWHEVEVKGPPRWLFEVIARPMESGPATEGWVLVIRDVTQERAVEQRVQQQERLAAVGQLAAGIAHDFNNIMATIVLYARMSARAQELPLRIRGRLETINQQAKHATGLIQQILDFSRRAALERRPMDLLVFLKEQVKMLERTLPESIKIELACDKDDSSTLDVPSVSGQGIALVVSDTVMPEMGGVALLHALRGKG